MTTTIYYILVYFAEALICLQYTSTVFFKRHSQFKTYFTIFILYSVLFALSFLQNPYINTISFVLLQGLAFYFLYHTTLINAFFHALILTITMTFTELIALTIFSYTSFNFYENINFNNSTTVMVIICKLLYFIVSFFISHTICHKNSNEIRFSSKERLLLCTIPLLSLWISSTFVHLCLTTPLKYNLNMMISISMIFILFINILVFSLYEHIKQKNAQIAELKLQSQRDADSAEYYRTLSEQDEQQKILIHDIKKHLNAIADLNEHHETDKIAAYLTQVLGSPELQHSVRVCDNDLLNSLICRYQKICLMKKIAFHIDIRSKCIDFVSYDDLSILFGNLMDNAVESAEKMAVDPFIELSVFCRENTNMTIITLIDSCRVNPIDKDGNLVRTKKPNPQFHGFGVKSIANVVKRYDGEMTFYYDDPSKTFHMIMMLRNPDDYIYRH